MDEESSTPVMLFPAKTKSNRSRTSQIPVPPQEERIPIINSINGSNEFGDNCHRYPDQPPKWKIWALQVIDKIEETLQRFPVIEAIFRKLISMCTIILSFIASTITRSGLYHNCNYIKLSSHPKEFVYTNTKNFVFNKRHSPKKIFLGTVLVVITLYFLDYLYSYWQGRTYHLAKYHSYDFFRDVPQHQWKIQQSRFQQIKPHKFGNFNKFVDEPNAWYHNNWDQDFTCPSARKVGVSTTQTTTKKNDDAGWLGDGPKWVCDPERIVGLVNNRVRAASNRNNHNFWWSPPSKSPLPTMEGGNGCLIYSIGVNSQSLDFEHGIQNLLTRIASGNDVISSNNDNKSNIHHEKHHNQQKHKPKPFCEIHVFDPAGWKEKLPVIQDGIYYHNWGITGSSNTDFGASSAVGAIDSSNDNFKTFQETVRELGHVGHIIDIMKVDCKLCEWDIYQDWFDNGIGDVNTKNTDSNEMTGVSMIHQLLVEVHGSPEQYVNPFFDKMRKENYVIFHKEANTQFFGGTCQDYAFLKLRPEFFL